MDGVLNIDKPPGLSSAALVTNVKRLLPRTLKVGHAGTLDPFATGVLVVLIGNATRLAERFMSEPKQYITTIKLGATTDTLDPTSHEIVAAAAAPPSSDAVEQVLRHFVGQIQQTPPAYSALKVRGVPAYKLARQGRPPQLQPRTVSVYGIELIRYAWPTIDLTIDCGRGTYIRAIARDIGQALGVGAYLLALRRTRVGPCLIKDALTLDQLQQRGVEKCLCIFGR